MPELERQSVLGMTHIDRSQSESSSAVFYHGPSLTTWSGPPLTSPSTTDHIDRSFLGLVSDPLRHNSSPKSVSRHLQYNFASCSNVLSDNQGRHRRRANYTWVMDLRHYLNCCSCGHGPFPFAAGAGWLAQNPATVIHSENGRQVLFATTGGNLQR